jgi:hypothetical protein
LILSARAYRSKATLSLDSILELEIENKALKFRLENLLRAKGVDPATNPILKELSSSSEKNDAFAEIFLQPYKPRDEASLDDFLRPGYLDTITTENHNFPFQSYINEQTRFPTTESSNTDSGQDKKKVCHKTELEKT